MHRKILRIMDDPLVRDWEPLKESMLNYFNKNPHPKGVVFEKTIEFNKRIEKEIAVNLEFEMYRTRDYTVSALGMKDVNYMLNQINFIQAMRRCPSVYADNLARQNIADVIAKEAIDYKDQFLFPVLKHCLDSLRKGDKYDG